MKTAKFSCKNRDGVKVIITIEYRSKKELADKRLKLSLDYPVQYPIFD